MLKCDTLQLHVEGAGHQPQKHHKNANYLQHTVFRYAFLIPL